MCILYELVNWYVFVWVCMLCVCVCVWEREREWVNECMYVWSVSVWDILCWRNYCKKLFCFLQVLFVFGNNHVFPDVLSPPPPPIPTQCAVYVTLLYNFSKWHSSSTDLPVTETSLKCEHLFFQVFITRLFEIFSKIVFVHSWLIFLLCVDLNFLVLPRGRNNE